jgi:L,D-transpeptidase ErfK/SrfK
MKAFLSAILAFTVLFFGERIYADSYSSVLCKNDSFTCYKVKRGDTWQKLFLDPEQKDLVMRLNRMNVPLERGMKIAIPKDLSNTDIMNYAPFPKQITPRGQKMIFVSLNSKVLAWAAYSENGELQNWGPASGGQGWCPDVHRACHTSTGHFAVYRKSGASCVSSKFPVNRGGAPMPYCMFFHGGFALHGSHEVPGYNASHGCVRMFVPDAKWLNQEFLMDDDNVPVIISNQL